MSVADSFFSLVKFWSLRPCVRQPAALSTWPMAACGMDRWLVGAVTIKTHRDQILAWQNFLKICFKRNTHQKQCCKNKFILTQPCKNLGHRRGSGAKADETARPQHRIPAKTNLWNKLCFPNGLVNALCSLNLQSPITFSFVSWNRCCWKCAWQIQVHVGFFSLS